jgi:hypothetical protein
MIWGEGVEAKAALAGAAFSFFHLRLGEADGIIRPNWESLEKQIWSRLA